MSAMFITVVIIWLCKMYENLVYLVDCVIDGSHGGGISNSVPNTNGHAMLQ